MAIAKHSRKPKRAVAISHAESHMAGRVMERIRVENIQMRPLFAFVLRNIILGLCAAVLFLLGVFFLSLAFSHLSVLRPFGLQFILTHVPWFGLSLGACCMALCFALIEYYKLLYKWTLIKLALVIVVLFSTGGFLVSKLPFYDDLLAGPLSPVYSIEDNRLDVIAGNIIEVRTEASFTIQTIRNERIQVYVSTQTRLPRLPLSEGQAVFVSGRRDNGRMYAHGIINLGKSR